jgi:hypothetical protein
MKLRFGKPGKKKDHRLLHIWLRRLQGLLTLILGFLTVFLFLTGLAEIGIYLFSEESSTYVDWIRAPIVIFAASLVCFILYLAVNYNRIKLFEPLRNRRRKSAPPKNLDIPELD